MVMTQLGDLEHAMAEYPNAKLHLEEALAIWRAIDDQPHLAWTIFQVAVLHSTIGEYQEAEALFDEALAIYRRLNEPWFVALVLMQIAGTVMSYDDFGRATKLLAEAVPIFRQQERTNIMAVALNLQGWAEVQQGDYLTAVEHFKEALAIGQLEGNLQSRGWSLRNLSMAHLMLRRLSESEQYVRACLRDYQTISFKSGTVIGFELLAAIAAERGKAEESVRWLAVAGHVRHSIGLPRTASEERLYYNRTRQLTGEALSQQAWDAAWAAGSKLTLDEAFAIVLADNK
jgi:tetratricopeptide (TPR) repeat protein